MEYTLYTSAKVIVVVAMSLFSLKKRQVKLRSRYLSRLQTPATDITPAQSSRTRIKPLADLSLRANDRGRLQWLLAPLIRAYVNEATAPSVSEICLFKACTEGHVRLLEGS